MTGLLARLRRAELLALTALVWFLAKFLRYAFPPLFEPLQAGYGVSTAVVGTAFTGLMVVYAAMQFPSGLLADRLGSVRVIAAGAVVAGTAALGLSVDAPLPVLVAAMLAVGAGTGVHKTVAVRLLSRAYPARTGRAVGVLDTVGALGGVAAPAAVVAVGRMPGVSGARWRTVFLAAGLATVALAVAFAVRAGRHVPGARGRDAVAATPDPGDATPDTSATAPDPGALDLRRYASLLAEPRLAGFVAVTVLFGFGYNGFVAFLPLYLTVEAGLAPEAASLAYGALFLASLVQVATGDVGDRVGHLPVVAATLGLATAALAALVVLTPTADPVVLGGAAVVVGLGAHGYRPVRGSYLVAAVPRATMGGSLGAVRTVLMAAGSVSPAVVGWLSEAAGFRPAFWLLVASMAAATVLAFGLLGIE